MPKTKIKNNLNPIINYIVMINRNVENTLNWINQ